MHADQIFDAVSKFEEELVATLAALDAPLVPAESKMHQPIIGDYFLINENGIIQMTRLPLVQEQVHTITLDSGVKIYFWQPKDTTC